MTPATRAAKRHRTIEDVMAITGLIIVGLYALGELAHSVGYQLGACGPEHGNFPWGTFFLATICILPKTVGRASAGRIWDKLGGNIKPGGKE